MARRLTVVDLDAGGFVAAEVVPQRGGVRLVASAARAFPDALDLDDAGAVGAYIAHELRAAGVKCRTTILSVPRGQVSVKALDIAGAGSLTAKELGEAVRFQMQRQHAVQHDEGVIDHLPPPGGDAGGDEDGVHAADSRVVAAAIPAATLARYRAVASAAKFKLAGVRLRSSGGREAVDALGEAGAGIAGDVMGVAWQPSGAELFVGRAGRLVFARGVDVPRPGEDEDSEAGARRLAVEVARTLVSFRVSPAGGDVAEVVVLGDDGPARAAAEAISATAGLSARTTVRHDDRIGGLERAPEGLVGPLLPLLGLAVQDGKGERCLDFENPLRPPDTSARTRQLVLASVLGLILAGGGGFVWADGQTRSLDPEIDRLKSERRALQDRYVELLLDAARVGHAEAWMDGRADVIAHVNAAAAQLPAPPTALLDEIGVTARAVTGFTPESDLLDPDAYFGRAGIEARVAGQVGARDVSAALRGRLLDLGLYRSVSSRGAEVEGRFTFDLVSVEPAPGSVAPPQPAGEGGS
jgi:hypothetical protein